MSEVQVRKQLPPLPERFRLLKVDARGYPVPKFVAWVDGKPDHRIVDPKWIPVCVNERRCWLCGEKLGRYMAFVIGPMCAVNRISSEPPSHRECAEFAAKACPFLTRPMAQRREAGLPEELQMPAGLAIARNPGVTLVWVTTGYKIRPGPLFHIDEATEALWFAEGRAATRDEVMHSIETGLPILLEIAQGEGARSLHELEAMRLDAMRLVPA